MQVKVSLREKKISKSRSSLYLDFYPAILNQKTGRLTRRQFLGKYVYKKAKTIVEKQHNSETMVIAERIRQMKQNQIDKPEIYTDFEKERLRIKAQGEQSFIKYYKKIADIRKGSTYDNWIAAGHYLDAFTKGTLTFAQLDEAWCESFKKYLLSVASRKSDKVKLSQNSAVSYFNKITAALKQAFKDGIIPTDLGRRVEGIKYVETHRQYLNLQELESLMKTKSPLSEEWRRASIFSALTGLRFSDIKKLIWGEIHYNDNDGYSIEYIQKKTSSAELHQISQQAFELLGDRGEANHRVFKNLQYSAYNNRLLRNWAKDAGIKKYFTFHCLRHTYATLLLSRGVDLFTVSKMLGHKDFKTTMIYAKVINSTKREAADKMNFDFLQTGENHFSNKEPLICGTGTMMP